MYTRIEEGRSWFSCEYEHFYSIFGSLGVKSQQHHISIIAIIHSSNTIINIKFTKYLFFRRGERHTHSREKNPHTMTVNVAQHVSAILGETKFTTEHSISSHYQIVTMCCVVHVEGEPSSAAAASNHFIHIMCLLFSPFSCVLKANRFQRESRQYSRRRQ